MRKLLLILFLGLFPMDTLALELELPDGPFETREIVVLKVHSEDSLSESRIIHHPRNGASVMRGYDGENNPVIWFFTKREGKYLVRLEVGTDGLDDYAEVEFQVGKETPTPNPQPGPGPEPNPNPNPTPTSDRLIVVIHERGLSGEAGAKKALVMTEIRKYVNEKENLTHRFVDQNQKDSQDQTPQYLTDWISAMKKAGARIPVLMVLAPLTEDPQDEEDYSVLGAIDLPYTADEVIDFIGENGG
jgi:hypothetical protein